MSYQDNKEIIIQGVTMLYKDLYATAADLAFRFIQGKIDVGTPYAKQLAEEISNKYIFANSAESLIPLDDRFKHDEELEETIHKLSRSILINETKEDILKISNQLLELYNDLYIVHKTNI